MTRQEDFARAAEVARAALTHVYEPTLVDALRSDSPLPGHRSADAIAIVVAVREESASRGRLVTLSDAHMVSIHTFGDLTRELELLAAGDISE